MMAASRVFQRAALRAGSTEFLWVAMRVEHWAATRDAQTAVKRGPHLAARLAVYWVAQWDTWKVENWVVSMAVLMAEWKVAQMADSWGHLTVAH